MSERPNFKQRILELDGLRGLALLMVIFFHYIEPGKIPRYVSAFGRMNWSAINLFFVLSGFLIGGILLDARTASNYFKTFYIRRAYRILPLYIFIVLAFWISLNLVSGIHHPALSYLFYRPFPWYIYATLTQNVWAAYHGWLGPPFLGPTWSLPVEEQFYLALPLVIRFIKPARLPYFLASAIIIAPILRAVLYITYVHGGWAAYVLMPCQADALMLGVSAAVLVRSRVGWNYLITHRRFMNVTLGVLFVGMVWAGHKKWMHVTTFPMSSIGYTWVDMFYVVVLLVVVSQPKNWISRGLRTGILTGLGRISYGAYLFHIAVLAFCYTALRDHAPPPADAADFATTGLAFGLTLIFATLSWLFFEKPLLKVGHTYKYKQGRKLEFELTPEPS